MTPFTKEYKISIISETLSFIWDQHKIFSPITIMKASVRLILMTTVKKNKNALNILCNLPRLFRKVLIEVKPINKSCLSMISKKLWKESMKSKKENGNIGNLQEKYCLLYCYFHSHLFISYIHISSKSVHKSKKIIHKDKNNKKLQKSQINKF